MVPKWPKKMINEKGGLNGTPIKLAFQDTGGDEAGAINAFQNLISRDKVVAIIGPTLSQQAFAADPIANQAKVPVVGPSNTAKGGSPDRRIYCPCFRAHDPGRPQRPEARFEDQPQDQKRGRGLCPG